MESINCYQGIDSYLVSQVTYHAKKLVQSSLLEHEPLEDIEQDLMLHCLTKLAIYDARRASWKTFIDRILNHKSIDIIRKVKAKKSNRNLETQQGRHDMYQLTESCQQDLGSQDLSIDLRRATLELNPQSSWLLSQLSTYSLPEIARIHNLSYKKVYGILRSLRTQLTDAQLDQYLK